MNDEFLDYYSRELHFLREMGAGFAAAHPQEAQHLRIEAGRCEDPHVERMIEAVAFLTARIRQKLDDEYPEITDALLSVLYPHYQQPIPSMAIIQFVPAADSTRISGGHLIERGTELSTPAIQGTRCRFRTASPVTLWPVVVDSATLAPDKVMVTGKPPGAVALLTLTLRCTAPGGWASLEGFNTLRFFLDGIGGEVVSTSLYESLFNNLAEVWVRPKGAQGLDQVQKLPPGSIQAVGFDENEALLPYPSRSFPGYRLLQEFFAFPSKFLFFDVTGLSRIRAANFSGPVEVLFFLKQPPKNEVLVRPENFKLGCAPVVNLFEMASEPIRLTHLQTTYAVVPRYGELRGHEVHSIGRVTSSGSYLEGSIEFQPFYAMKHASRGTRRDAYWFSSRRPSLDEDDSGIEVDLSFVDLNFSPMIPTVETITAHLTCTNRDLPRKLPFGGDRADFVLESEAPVGRVRLLTQPTKTHRAPLGQAAQWRLISQLGLNHLSLVENEQGPDALRELLALYAFDYEDSAITRKMIDGVIGVSSKKIAARTGSRLGNTLSQGLEIKVHFDEDAYAGSGAFLMATVLERFLGAYVSINSFTQMMATSKQREDTWKKWAPRSGDRTLL